MKSSSNPHGFIYSLKRNYFTFIVKKNLCDCDYHASTIETEPVWANCYPAYNEKNI